MANAYLLSSRLSDLAALTVSDAVSGAGATNLQKARPKLRWRSTTTTPYIQGDFGSAKTVDTLTLGFINGQSGDTFRLRMASTQAKLTDGTAEYDSTSTTVWPTSADLSLYKKVHRCLKFTQQTLRWFRIDFNFSSNTDGFVSMGRLMLGKRVEPTRSVKAGWAPGFEEPVAETVDLGGEESARIMGAKRSLNAMWHDVTQTELDLIYATLLERGSAKDIVLTIDPDVDIYIMTQTVIGRVKEALQFPHTGKFNTTVSGQHFSFSLTVSEMAPTEMA